VILVTDILARLQTAASTDTSFLAAVATLFGADATLTLQVGADPMHEVSAQDCPLVAFLDDGKAETGQQSPTWRFPIEIQLYVCDGEVTAAESAPAGTRLLTSSGQVDLDAFAGAMRTLVQTQADAMNLAVESLAIELDPANATFWPRQRAYVSVVLTVDNIPGTDPELPALPTPDPDPEPEAP